MSGSPRKPGCARLATRRRSGRARRPPTRDSTKRVSATGCVKPRPVAWAAGRVSFLRLRVSCHPRGDDAVWIAHRLPAFDLVHVLHALDDLAPHGVFAVEEARIVEADEELAVAGIRRLR